MLAIGTVVGLAVLAGLVVFFFRTRSKDLLEEKMSKRRATCRLVSRADYIEGMNEIPVSLALSDTTIYYENSDLDAMFDLSRIDEIEYDDESATGRSVPAGCRALRLRAHGTAFEFVMPAAEIAKWQQALPARVVGAPTARAV